MIKKGRFMILKLKKESDGKWMFGVYRGNGGISSLIRTGHGMPFFMALGKLLNPKYLYRAIVYKNS